MNIHKWILALALAVGFTLGAAEQGGVSTDTQIWDGNKILTNHGVRDATLTGNDTLTRDSLRFQRLDGGGSNRDVTLPAAEQGQWFMIWNVGTTNDLVVKDADANTIVTVNESKVGWVAVTTAGAWKGVEFGAAFSGGLLADGTVAGATGQAQDFGTNGITADVIDESTGAAGVTIDGVLVKDGGAVFADGAAIDIDVINEATAATGVTADGVLLKDGSIVTADGGSIEVDTVNEATAANGVTIDGALIKDSGATFNDITGGDASMAIAGLAGSGGSAGGAIPITGGAGHTNGAGGAVPITGGAGAGSGVGGAATITGGLGGATNAVGGAATVTAGAGQGTGNGAIAGLVGGASGAGATGAGGIARVIGGAAASTNGAGGAGQLTGGAGAGTGAGGAATITGGASGAGATGNGGAATLTGGAALSTDGNGGAANLTGGVATGTGTGGGITLATGASAGAGGTAGSIAIDTGGAAGGTAGTITIGGTNSGTIAIGRSGQQVQFPGTVRATNTGLLVLDTGGDHTTNLKQNSDEGANRILNIPALGGDDTIVTLATAQTVSGAKTHSANLIAGNTNLWVLDTGGDHKTNLKQNSDEAADRTLNIPALGGNDTLMTLGVPGTVTGNVTFSGSVIRASQRLRFGIGGAKVGGTAGFTVGAADNVYAATCPASQTGSKLVVPIPAIKVGSTITAFGLLGQIESAGNGVTVDADLRKSTAATGDFTDASVSTLTQVSVSADSVIDESDDKTGLSETVTQDDMYYIVITVTTNANTDVDIRGITLVVTEN